MKVLTVHEPWASLIACGAKKIETRSWKTNYRGPLAIHSSKNCAYLNFVFTEPFYSALKHRSGCMAYFDRIGGGRRVLFPDPGSIIAIADLVDCVQVIGFDTFANSPILDTKYWLLGDSRERAFGDYSIGRYAWILENAQTIEPVPAKGKQRIWEWKEDK